MVGGSSACGGGFSAETAVAAVEKYSFCATVEKKTIGSSYCCEFDASRETLDVQYVFKIYVRVNITDT